MAKILDGKKLGEEIAEKLKKKASAFSFPPTLAIIQIGSLSESNSYIERKKKYGEKIGVKVEHIALPESATTEEVISKIENFNKDETVKGIIVQLPIPQAFDKRKIIEAIDPGKDVDGLHHKNAGVLYERASSIDDLHHFLKGFTPATAKGIMSLLAHYQIQIQGKRALVIGRSMLVGRPVALLLLKENATVTIAHSKTKNLKDLCHEADIIVVAVGCPKLLTKDFFREGQVVVDVGTNAIEAPKILDDAPKMKLVGDVDFEEVEKIVEYISPVPGGVGPMTVASLFENLIEGVS